MGNYDLAKEHSQIHREAAKAFKRATGLQYHHNLFAINSFATFNIM
jgi:hypothetical protein